MANHELQKIMYIHSNIHSYTFTYFPAFATTFYEVPTCKVIFWKKFVGLIPPTPHNILWFLPP